ncbi:MAG: ABC transporter ATP-binding protein [Chthoniobacterales bacterium]|jgi:ABC-2 type transport system ATP-binding protein|nr:ABC transporter ATP-binding protein [Chthoniobacterales bacterium]
MSDPVETTDLRRSFGGRTALDGVTLSVREGEIFGLLGPNGGGKTTLFRILCTLLPPSGGRARVCGHDTVAAAAAVRASIGVVFQSPSLDPQLTVAENLRYGGNLYGLRGAELEARWREMAVALRVDDRAGDMVKNLSGGLQRRVEIAKSLLPRPRVLLLDEPSTGLDPVARVDLWAILEQLRVRFGITTVLTTHLMDEAERCGRVGILHLGKLLACDSPDALRATIGADVLTLVCRRPDAVAERLQAEFGWTAVVRDDAVRVEIPKAHAEVARIVEAFPGEIQSVTAGRPTLEDVFVRMTGERLGVPFFEDGKKNKKKK